MTAPVATRLGRDNIFVEAQMLQSLLSRYVPLQAALTSTDFDGDSFSTVGKTLIDLSVSFGAPAGIRAVVVDVLVQDSDATGTDAYLLLSPVNTNLEGTVFKPPVADDRFSGSGNSIIACDANGDIYYQVVASGASTFDIYIRIRGYFI